MRHVIETKRFGGQVVETKTDIRNGVPVGILSGYMALWTPDRGGIFGLPDMFVPGAFKESLAEHKSRKNRQVRFKDNHGKLIGGFPIDGVFEDQKGLFGTAEVNLETQLGKEAHSLARQGVLVDFSVGFTALDDEIEGGLRKITKAILWETSVADEPMHIDANIEEVKAIVGFQDLELAPRLTQWTPQAARDRVRDFTESKDGPSDEYKSAFVWMDEDRLDRFEGYKFMIADIVDGKMMAIPRAIFKAANELIGKSIGIPEDDIDGVGQHIERYYAKMGLISPIGSDDKSFFGANEIKNFTRRDMEMALRDSGAFSKGAAIELASKFDGFVDPASTEGLLLELGKISFK